MPMRIKPAEFLGVRFDCLEMSEVLEILTAVRPESAYTFVVTPNVDHVVRLDDPGQRSSLGPIYEDADLSLCDSRVLKLLAKANGLRLPLVPGSDLTERLFRQVIRPHDRITVVGGDAASIEVLKRMYPVVEFIHYMPPMGLRQNAAAREEAAAFVAAAKSRFTFLAVGSPQQEMIAAAVRQHPGATGTALCIGASLEFITGRERRAPVLMQRLSLEWAFRLLSDPRRMWRRYLVEGPRVFAIAARYRWSSPAK
jgi:exopolysaccharide biosynthesis WecB/TagA/CpsF family protein